MAELSAVYEDVHDRIWEIEKVKMNLLTDIVIQWDGTRERVHFGAASRLKRGKESNKFPVAIFCPTFFLHYF